MMKRYTAEEKEKALERAREIGMSAAGKELGIGYSTLFAWKKAAGQQEGKSAVKGKKSAKGVKTAVKRRKTVEPEAAAASAFLTDEATLRAISDVLNGDPMAQYEAALRTANEQIQSLLKENALLKSALRVYMK